MPFRPQDAYEQVGHGCIRALLEECHTVLLHPRNGLGTSMVIQSTRCHSSTTGLSLQLKLGVR